MASPLPVISVVIATRNRPDMLRNALQAVAAQTYDRLEIILVDDGSSAEASSANQALLKQAARPYRYAYLETSGSPGSGPSFVRNHAITLSTAPLLAFCDDDDYWTDSDHLTASARLFAENDKVDLVFADQQERSGNTLVSAIRMGPLVERLNRGPLQTNRAFVVSKRDCLLNYFPHLNTCVMKRSLFDAAGRFWESVRYAEDCDLYVRCIEHAREVLYRDATVSVHNIPDRTKQLNASTALSEVDKQLTCAYISQHLLQSCRHPETIRYANDMAGDAYRRLALIAINDDDKVRAFNYARLALSARFSIKWALFTAWRGLKSI